MNHGRKNPPISVATDPKTIGQKAKLLDALPECIFLVAEDHTILAVNATAEGMMGTDLKQVIGGSLSSAMLPMLDGDRVPMDIDSSADRVMASGEAELLDAWFRWEESGESGEEELCKVAVTVLPMPSSQGVAIVVSGDAVRRPYGLRDAVLSMVSHELRTPLLHIKGFVSTLLESDIEWDEETRLDFLHTIDREADRLTSMVSDLMEITRMGSGDLPLHLEDADPYLLAYAALDEASPFINKHRVIVDVREDLPRINIDVLRITGVLVNLLENASKYAEDGTTVTIAAAANASDVTFSVSDEGNGIPQEIRSKLFSLFYRGEPGGERSSGTGLGLAVCKSVVAAHKGKIWVESEPGKGSTFTFSIPLKAARARKPRVSARSKKSNAKRALNGAETARSKRVKPAVAKKIVAKKVSGGVRPARKPRAAAKS